MSGADSDATQGLAFCALLAFDELVTHGRVILDEYQDESIRTVQMVCDYVCCARCRALGEFLEATSTGHAWVCSSCAHDWPVHVGYWSNGYCDICSNESIVLQLVSRNRDLVGELERRLDAFERNYAAESDEIP